MSGEAWLSRSGGRELRVRLAIIAASILLALWALLALGAQAAISRAAAAEVVAQRLEEEDVPAIATSWKYKDENGDCDTKTVTTTQQSGETWAETLQRHATEVREAKVVFPPAAPGECP